MTSDELLEFRLQLGLTQVELAALLGVPPLRISRWECGDGIRHPKILLLALERLACTRRNQ